MNKKEVLEIRKLLNKDRCCVERICGCYVDGHKEKKLKMKEAFLSLPEEEMFKYIESICGRRVMDSIAGAERRPLL